jgi:hypothetical protein
MRGSRVIKDLTEQVRRSGKGLWPEPLRPTVLGGSTPVLPDNVWLQLELLDERRFDNGVVHLHYRVKG